MTGYGGRQPYTTDVGSFGRGAERFIAGPEQPCEGKGAERVTIPDSTSDSTMETVYRVKKTFGRDKYYYINPRGMKVYTKTPSLDKTRRYIV